MNFQKSLRWLRKIYPKFPFRHSNLKIRITIVSEFLGIFPQCIENVKGISVITKKIAKAINCFGEILIKIHQIYQRDLYKGKRDACGYHRCIIYAQARATKRVLRTPCDSRCRASRLLTDFPVATRAGPTRSGRCDNQRSIVRQPNTTLLEVRFASSINYRRLRRHIGDSDSPIILQSDFHH